MPGTELVDALRGRWFNVWSLGSKTQVSGVMAADPTVVTKAAAMEWLKEERGGTGAIWGYSTGQQSTNGITS